MKWVWSRRDFVILIWDFECNFFLFFFLAFKCVGQVCMVHCSTHSACKTTHECKPRGVIVKNININLHARSCTSKKYIEWEIHITQGVIWKYDCSRFTMHRNTHNAHKTIKGNKSRCMIIQNINNNGCAWAYILKISIESKHLTCNNC